MKIIPIEYFLDKNILKEIEKKKSNSHKNLPIPIIAYFNLNQDINNNDINNNEISISKLGK
jgi:hypothetical protein